MVPEGLAVGPGGRDASGQVEPGIDRDGGSEVPPQRVVEDVAGPDAAIAEEERVRDTAHIRVSAERRNGWWEFAVADNGIGIEAKYLDRIFEMFRRLHTQDQY